MSFQWIFGLFLLQLGKEKGDGELREMKHEGWRLAFMRINVLDVLDSH